MNKLALALTVFGLAAPAVLAFNSEEFKLAPSQLAEDEESVQIAEMDEIEGEQAEDAFLQVAEDEEVDEEEGEEELEEDADFLEIAEEEETEVEEEEGALEAEEALVELVPEATPLSYQYPTLVNLRAAWEAHIVEIRAYRAALDAQDSAQRVLNWPALKSTFDAVATKFRALCPTCATLNPNGIEKAVLTPAKAYPIPPPPTNESRLVAAIRPAFDEYYQAAQNFNVAISRRIFFDIQDSFTRETPLTGLQPKFDKLASATARAFLNGVSIMNGVKK